MVGGSGQVASVFVCSKCGEHSLEAPLWGDTSPNEEIPKQNEYKWLCPWFGLMSFTLIFYRSLSTTEWRNILAQLSLSLLEWSQCTDQIGNLLTVFLVVQTDFSTENPQRIPEQEIFHHYMHCFTRKLKQGYDLIASGSFPLKWTRAGTNNLIVSLMNFPKCLVVSNLQVLGRITTH